MNAIRIEQTHLAAIALLEEQCFHHPWSAASLALLCTDTAFGFVCFDGDVAAAYGGMLTVLDEGQITNIATAPAYRRQGLGAVVLSALLAHARERGLVSVTLEARVSNTPAIALYRKLGFLELGRRKNFYTQPTEDALIMGITL